MSYDDWKTNAPEPTYEVKEDAVVENGLTCSIAGCQKDETHIYWIGPIREKWSKPIGLCKDHDDLENAFQVFFGEAA